MEAGECACDDLVHNFGTLHVDEFEEVPLKNKRGHTEARHGAELLTIERAVLRIKGKI